MASKISIITVNYNNAIGLKKTIASVIAQSYSNLEYIIVDGNSTDESKNIISLFSEENPDINWISEDDTGIYNAMNKGIDIATGEFLLFLNSGDYLNGKTIVEEAISLFDNNSPIKGCDLVLDTKSEKVRKSHPESISFSYLLSKTIYHPSTFIERNLFEVYGKYNEKNRIVSDWEFFFKTIGLNSIKFQRITIPLTCFDMTGISSKSDNLSIIISEKEQVLKSYLSSMDTGTIDSFLFGQFKNPSKRIKYLSKIESRPLARKIATGFLKLLSTIKF